MIGRASSEFNIGNLLNLLNLAVGEPPVVLAGYCELSTIDLI